MITWDAIVLDLDDTLYDTTGNLLPAADRRALAVLRDRGLPLDESEGLARVHALRAGGAAEPFRALAAQHGLAADAARAAEAAFFRYDVPALKLDAAVEGALADLRAIAPLALLTTGDPQTQRAKAERLGLAAHFARMEFVQHGGPDGKTGALRALVASEKWRPGHVVFAGDRLDGDVRAANRCGCRSVWVRREGAEFAAMTPAGPDDAPWRTIAHVRELPAVLRG